MYSGHHLAGQNTAQQHSDKDRNSHYVLHAESVMSSLAWPCMEDRPIPKDLLYVKLATDTRHPGSPTRRFKDVCKHDMKASNIDPETWEFSADDHDHWHQTV